MKKVSVIIPTYNKGPMILKAMDSVLRQTFQDYEVIIVDDGSTDDTKNMLSPFLDDAPDKIKYLYQENSGASRARNFAIEKAQGKYIAFLDSDDKWTQNKLYEMIKFMEAYQYDWGCSATYRVSNGNFEKHEILRMPEKFLENDRRTLCLTKHGLFSFTGMPIFPGCVVIKKSAFQEVGGFDPEFVIGEDSDLWMKLEEGNYRGGYLDVPLYFYNKNETSISLNAIRNFDENLRLAKKHLKLLHLDKKILRISYSDFLWEYAQLYYLNGRKVYSVYLLMRSFLFHPDLGKIYRVFKNLYKFINPFKRVHSENKEKS